jgi:hypothetical protein
MWWVESILKLPGFVNRKIPRDGEYEEDKPPKKTQDIELTKKLQDVRDPLFFFCTAAHSSAQTCQDDFCFTCQCDNP